MQNIIREDIVRVGWDVDSSPLDDLRRELDALKKQLGGLGGDKPFDDIGDGARGSKQPVRDTTKEVDKLKQALNDVGKKAAVTAYNGLKKVAGISFKALTAGVTATAGAIGAMVAKSVEAFAEYEQLKGGVETLFGAKGTKSVQEYAEYTGKSVSEVQAEYDKLVKAQEAVLGNANKAYLTAGLSANDYMNTVTSFSASLIQSLEGDTTKAAELSDKALRDMADNANKMGTDISMIQSAYAGFARGNYMMLDNLKLGYAGSKTELERLLKDAEEYKASMGETVDYDVSSYADVIEAIHAIQEKMGITGTTAKEAKETVTGSLNAMKAAWGNLLIAMGSGDGLDECMDNMLETAETFMGNIMPVAEKALVAMGTLVERVVPIIEERLPELAEKLLPPLIKAAVSLTKGLIAALPSIVKTLGTTLGDILGEQFPALKQLGDIFAENSEKIASFIPVAVGAVAALAGLSKLKSIGSALTGLFGKGGAGGGADSEKSGGIFGIFEKLAKMKTRTILKGIANLAVIIGGFTLITAALLVIAPAMAELADFKSLTEMFAVLSIVAVEGMLMSKAVEPLAKMKVTTVLRGIANLAITITAFTALTAAFMAISPLIAEIGDTKSLFKLIGLMTVLGLVGTALTAFAGYVGKIPITTVLKGIANIALVVAGMTALTVLLSFASLLDFDYKRMFALVGLIGVLGTVGAALTVFAGIAGIIPIPVVLAGLANMALVLGGVTALIVAFGALSEIKGLSDFITKGGDLLAQLFGVIGKVAGSLVGGLAEGLTDSLPAIGKNLAGFATSLKPMFTAFQGVDASGIGTFFTSLASFMLKMSGNDILSIFTGGTNFAKLGKDLSTFAEGSQGFFTKVAEFPENGFSNASKLFECLAGIKSLPKDGGVVGWFAGEVNYASIAAGLKELSGCGVKNFFTMVGGLDEKAFSNTTKLFDTLGGIKSLPKQGGFWQNLGDAITGKETKSSLSVIADDLSNFASKTGEFFALVNSLNLGNLNGLWESLKNSDTITSNVSKVVGDNIDDIVKKVTDLPQKMGDAIKSSSESFSSAFVAIWKEAIQASVSPVNTLLSGANHILKEFGSNKRLIEWQPYAKGTNGHKGGNALVNDGNGAELVQMPNGKSFIPKGRNVLIPNAPAGMKVLSAENTARLFGKGSPTFSYANGIGNIDVWSFYDNAQGLVEKLTEKISYDGMADFPASLGRGIVSTFAGELPTLINKLFTESVQSITGYVSSKGVTQWLPTVVRALKMEGQYNVLNVARTLFQMASESGGNPHAINLWDRNAKNGTPSKGLMQVIDPTFNAYARSGFDKDIYDPLSNVLASIRYAVSRYGSLAKAFRGKGYANGGVATSPSIFGEDGAEMAIPLSTKRRRRGLKLWGQAGEMLGAYTPESESGNYSSKSVVTNTYSPQLVFHISGSTDDRTLTRRIKSAVQQAFNEMVDEIERNA